MQRIFWISVIALWLSGWGTLNADTLPIGPQATDRIRFFALGDQGTGDRFQKQVARAMEQVAERTGGVDFVLLLGDNFYPDGVTSVTDPQWSSAFETVYQGRWLSQTPFLAVLGNHDVRSAPEAQTAYGLQSLGSGRWRMRERQTWLDLGQNADQTPLMRLVLLDTNQPVEEQALFARHALSAPGQPIWRIAAGHHPLLSSGRHGSQAWLLSGLLPVFRQERVNLYLAGHDHHQEWIRQPGKPAQLISGAGGRALYRVGKRVPGSEFASEGRHGFARIEVTGESVLVQFHDDQGALLHQSQMTVNAQRNEPGP